MTVRELKTWIDGLDEEALDREIPLEILMGVADFEFTARLKSFLSMVFLYARGDAQDEAIGLLIAFEMPRK